MIRKLIFFCLLLPFLITAQPEKVKYGKISTTDLEMLEYAPDPEAEAVVLADHGHIDFDFSGNDIQIVLHRIKRIKVLKNSGKKGGDINIHFYSKYQNVDGLKAQVIQPDGTKISVKKNDFFEEKMNEYNSRMKFTMPALQIGSIIEYEYRKTSNSIFTLPEWYFQSEYPVRESYLKTSIPTWYRYVSMIQGARPKHNKSITRKNILPPRLKSTKSNTLTGAYTMGATSGVDANIEITEYWLTDVPKLTTEPFITTMDDYYSRVKFQLQSIQYPNSDFQPIMSTWESVAKALREDRNFGGQLDKKSTHRKLLELAESQIDDSDSNQEKLVAILKLINKKVKWNDLIGIAATQNLDKCLESGHATAAELNLMCIVLCRAYNINAYPVLISTRSNGRTFSQYPFLDQFNMAVCLIEIDGKFQTVDVASWELAPGSLRPNFQNYTGWVIMAESNEWVQMPIPVSTSQSIVEIKYKPEGDFEIDCKVKIKGNYIYELKENCSHSNCIDSYKEYYGGSQQHFTINNLDVEESELIKGTSVNFQAIGNAGYKLGDELLYLELPLKLMDENPLKLKNREFAVDIPATINETIVNILDLPEGYELEETPAPIKLGVPDGGAEFSYRHSLLGNKLQIITKLKIDRLQYATTEYQIIRGFFEQMTEKLKELVVLKKA